MVRLSQLAFSRHAPNRGAPRSLQIAAPQHCFRGRSPECQNQRAPTCVTDRAPKHAPQSGPQKARLWKIKYWETLRKGPSRGLDGSAGMDYGAPLGAHTHTHTHYRAPLGEHTHAPLGAHCGAPLGAHCWAPLGAHYGEPPARKIQVATPKTNRKFGILHSQRVQSIFVVLASLWTVLFGWQTRSNTISDIKHVLLTSFWVACYSVNGQPLLP